LDVNVFVSYALNQGGVSARIVGSVRSGNCAIGPVQLIVSWRMLTTLNIVLRTRFGWTDYHAIAACDAITDMASEGPASASPYLLLGGTGVIPVLDGEDGGVLDTALAAQADLLVTHDLDDFERGGKSKLATRRLVSKPNGGPAAILIDDPIRGLLPASIPAIAIGWLSGQANTPAEVSARWADQ
jgi:predicted nucleic acid-binding protein